MEEAHRAKRGGTMTHIQAQEIAAMALAAFEQYEAWRAAAAEPITEANQRTGEDVVGVEECPHCGSTENYDVGTASLCHANDRPAWLRGFNLWAARRLTGARP